MKKISLRLRLTLISVALLLLCCLGLTLVLGRAAGTMADAIEAIPVQPAFTVGQEGAPPTAVPVVPSETSRQARTLFNRQSYFYMLLIVAAGGVMTWFVTGHALRPLGKLSEEMGRRTVENLSDELPVPESRDEIASLTRSFNQMSRKLDDSFSMQKRFAQSAAHELRTPLTVLKAKVDVFGKRTDHTPEEYAALLALVEKQTDRLSELVNDLLGLTGLDELPCNQRVALGPLLEETVRELLPLAAAREMTLELEAADGSVMGNANLLGRAVSNLAENALKYGRPGGSVFVSSVSEHGAVFIRVRDDGPGIPKDQKELIFEPFYRVDKSRSRQMGGAGLGLATVKAIVDKHGGTVTVEDAPGGGSIFTIRLKSK